VKNIRNVQIMFGCNFVALLSACASACPFMRVDFGSHAAIQATGVGIFGADRGVRGKLGTNRLGLSANQLNT